MSDNSASEWMRKLRVRTSRRDDRYEQFRHVMRAISRVNQMLHPNGHEASVEALFRLPSSGEIPGFPSSAELVRMINRLQDAELEVVGAKQALKELGARF